MRPISYFLHNPYQIVMSAALKMKAFIPDKQYIKILFRGKMGYPLNLKNPKTLCEKLNWLKLYDRNPRYFEMADKYAVKSYVTQKLGGGHLL